MKRLVMIFLAMLAFATAVRAQSVVVSDTLEARFVGRTVEEYFAYWGKSSYGRMPKHNITLITGIDARLLPDTVAGLPVRVLKNEEQLRKRKNRRLTKDPIYKVRLLVPDPDTIMIDVELVKWNVSFEGKVMRIEASCGGDMGYIPDGRFVYDEKERRWSEFFYEELFEQKAKEIKAIRSATTTTTVPSVSQDGAINDTAAKGMLIIYHCNSSLPPDTIRTKHSGVQTMYLYHGSEVEYHDMQEPKIEGVEVKVKY